MNNPKTRKIPLLLLLLMTCSLGLQAAVSTVVTASFCEPTNYLFGCRVLSTTGVYYDTLQSAALTDSIVELRLTIGHKDATTAVSATITEGEDYLFGCRTLTGLTAAGSPYDYKDTLSNVTGCDSVVTLTLTVNPACDTTRYAYSATITDGELYLFGCDTLKTAGVYTDTLVNYCGWDSIIVLTLHVMSACPIDSTEITATITPLDTYLFGCKILGPLPQGTHAFRDTLANQCGSDSIVKLVLNVYNATPCLPSSYAYNDTVLMNTDYLFGCTVYNFSMVCDTALHDTLSNYCGNDSVVTLNLHVYGYVETDKIDTVCAGTTFRGHTITADSTVFTDTTATLVPGTPDTITNWTVYIYDIPVPARMDSLANVGALPTAKQGCVIDVDPAILINYMNANRATGKTETVVDVEWQYKTAPSASYEPIDNTTKLAKDVDSIIVHYVITETECGTTVLHGGDTVIYCSAYEYRESTTVEQDTICDGDTLTWHGKKYAVAGIYKDSVTKSETTCNYDSIYTLNLTVRSATIIPEEWKVCLDELPLVWHNKTYTAAGIYGDTVKYNASTCDSIRYELTLIVQSPTDMSAEDSVVCEADMPVSWRGKTITAAGTYYDTLRYATGCDSVRYTLNLTVQTATGATATDTTACESDATLSWRGKTWTVADTTYYDTLRYAATGCDSVRYTLNITVQKAIDAAATDSIVCEADMPIVWRGQNITAAGTYYDTLHYATGCDSVYYELTLTVQSVAYATVEMDTICQGDTYTWRGYTFTEAGTYYDTLYYTTGCDSLIYQLDLAVWTVQQTDSLPAGAEYGMLVMVNRVKLRQDWNIDLTDDMTDKVLWYRVVGAVDEWLDMTTHLDPVNNPTDQDVFLGNGFYYTDGRNILPGEYYAVIDWALPTDAPCYTIWRTEVLTPQTPDAAPIRLLPNRVENGQTMLLTGIDLMGGTTTVRMISASGQTLETIVLDNEVQTELTAEGVPGVYLLRVDNETQHETLKYIIVK